MKAVLRAEGSTETGLGHVTRSLALGEALVGCGWNVTFATSIIPAQLRDAAANAGIDVYATRAAAGRDGDAAEIATLAPDLVVVDGYHFTDAFYARLSNSRRPYLVIDDNGDTRAASPLAVLNQNPHANASMYAHLSAVLLLGLDYVLLRSEIRLAKLAEPRRQGTPQVFVAMGGSDPRALTAPIAEALDERGIHGRVAIGAATRAPEAAANRVAGLRSVELVDPTDFVEVLAQSDLAIVGAGTTMWEAAYLGVPSVAVTVAANQVAPSTAAAHLGFVRSVDARAGADPAGIAAIVESLLRDRPALRAMSETGRRALDGLGCKRVADTMQRLVSAC